MQTEVYARQRKLSDQYVGMPVASYQKVNRLFHVQLVPAAGYKSIISNIQAVSVSTCEKLHTEVLLLFVLPIKRLTFGEVPGSRLTNIQVLLGADDQEDVLPSCRQSIAMDEQAGCV